MQQDSDFFIAKKYRPDVLIFLVLIPLIIAFNDMMALQDSFEFIRHCTKTRQGAGEWRRFAELPIK